MTSTRVAATRARAPRPTATTTEAAQHDGTGRCRVLLHEAWDWSLRRVVAEHLVEEMGMQVIEGLLSSPDLALVMVGSRDLEHVLGLTRAFIGSSPIVAVMARTDLDLARRALCGGAAACYALDTPLASLEAAVRDVLVPAATSVGEG